MRRLTLHGVAPAEAARVARELREPQAPVRDADATPASGSQAAVGLRRAALALDPAALERLARLALADGVVAAWTNVFAPALRELGRRYASSSRYIAAEHLLTVTVSAALGAVPRPAARPSVLLACAPAELHSLPLEALAAALAERDRASRMLGARVPAKVLRDAIGRTGPTAVVLWAHDASTASFRQLAAVVTAHPRPALIAACGPGWAAQSLPDGVQSLADLPEAVAATARLP